MRKKWIAISVLVSFLFMVCSPLSFITPIAQAEEAATNHEIYVKHLVYRSILPGAKRLTMVLGILIMAQMENQENLMARLMQAGLQRLIKGNWS